MTKGNGFQLKQCRFRVDIRKIFYFFFTMRVMKLCNRLLREAVYFAPQGQVWWALSSLV